MGSLQVDSDSSLHNDSGLGQDESMRKLSENGTNPHILDLSDDVLLYILRYCTPRDLKSLAYTCTRLGALVLDRTLWERVDARSEPVGPQRLHWFLSYGLSSTTSELLLSGFAREAEGCLGHMKCQFKDVEKEVTEKKEDLGQWSGGEFTYDPATRRGNIRGGPVIQIYETMPRATCFPLSDAFGPDIVPEWAPPDSSCPGPQFTLTPSLLKSLVARCPIITSLGLEYCNIDCTTRNISHFPRTLKKLSLRGSKCYNQPLDKSFLFKIQDYLTDLEELNISECEWIEPSALLPLSKLPALRRLYMRRCFKMTECVAYSSLATRYGFKQLQVIDLRESPVGDSEVSSFGWVSSLEELYVSPALHVPHVVHHAHYIGDELPEYIELDPWEEKEPEYFKNKQQNLNPDAEDMDCEGSGTLKRKMETTVAGTWDARNTEEVTAKKSKLNAVNEGASTSKWTPSEEPPPLTYFKGKSPEPSTSEKVDAEETTKSNDTAESALETETTKSADATESGPESPAGPSDSEEPPNDSNKKKPKKLRNGDLPKPSTSRQPPEFGKLSFQRYIRFRENQNSGANENVNHEPIHKVLYVNVGRRLHTMYRLSMPVYAFGEHEVMGENARRFDGPFATTRPDPRSLISDTTVQRFGRADNENISYINIGPNGIEHEAGGARPDRSNLRVLSLTGFRNITNRSLVHLATAAPRLRRVDFSGTHVTERGVENFRLLRPDCEVIFTNRSQERQ
ncbi:uncharacterized protein LOC115447685 isoform X2 [Manduca sexta]|uniref:F-box domain-containing protein n=2 Tax=Manduca sexta TaxID=7130 RepID=A0A922CSI0_MANSE|nr:uncharacterized protein LOC115447685 isoform X2 [Manduca sexta]KAG6456694.1 hypothetical protein O3G_MSEX009882 [Manduca sexta]